MTEGTVVRWVLKPIVWIGCLAPALWLISGIVSGDLGADPIKTLTHTTGLSALVILLVTLGISPLRRITGRNGLIRLRRPIGLFAFFYALLHFLIYAVFDHELSVAEISADVVEHPWVLVGFGALVILSVLAITSPAAVVRRMGGVRWQRLHKLIYLAAALGVLHFLLLVKKDLAEPLAYAVVLSLLLGVRLIPKRFWPSPVRRTRTGEKRDGSFPSRSTVDGNGGSRDIPRCVRDQEGDHLRERGRTDPS